MRYFSLARLSELGYNYLSPFFIFYTKFIYNMSFKSALTNPENLFVISLLVLLIFGSQGIKVEYIFPMVLLNAIVLLIYAISVRGKLIIPKHFGIYVIFILLLIFNTIFYRGEWRHGELFVSGGLFWLVFYNLPESILKKFSTMIIVFGGVMSLIFLYNKLVGVLVDNSFLSLSSPPSEMIKHSHIGDLWTVILVMCFYGVTKKSTLWHSILFIIGIYFLAVSMSRSAYVALIVGISYVSYRLGFEKKFRGIFVGLLATMAVIFVFVSTQKSTLFSRPYFIEALYRVSNHPLGLGMGYFIEISSGFEKLFSGFGSVSLYAHNIVLEVVLGMGIFSAAFLWWLFRVLCSLFKDKKMDILYSAVFISVLTNFFFDITYMILSFVLIWFMGLGLAQRNQQPLKELDFSKLFKRQL